MTVSEAGGQEPVEFSRFRYVDSMDKGRWTAGEQDHLGPEPGPRAGSGKALMALPIAVNLRPSQRGCRDSKAEKEGA
jgi:hypothetical protein